MINSGDIVAVFRDIRPWIASHHRTHFVIGPGRRLKP
jgi:hypothetical protein